MTLTRRLLLALPFLLLLPATTQAQSEQERFEKAFDLLNRLIYLEHRFDPAMAGLYADEARIVIIEVRGDRRNKTEMTGKELKVFIESYMPAASVTGELYYYSNVSITPEGDRMRILANRTGRKNPESFPYQLLVGPGPGGQYLIYEEQSIVAPK